MNPFLCMVTVAIQPQSVHLKLETDRGGRHGETVMGGRDATWCVVLTLGAEYAPTGMTRIALTERINSDGAIPPWQNYLLLLSWSIIKLSRSQLPSVSVDSHDYSCQVRTIPASRFVSRLARLCPPTASRYSLDDSLQVNISSYMMIASRVEWLRPAKCISNLALWCSQVHLQTRWITTSKCMSKRIQPRPPSSYDHALQVYLQTRSIWAIKFTLTRPPSSFIILLKHNLGVNVNIQPIMGSKWILRDARSLPQSLWLSSLYCHFQPHLELLFSSACSKSWHTMCRWVAI